jgi:hypothetical protein
MVLVAVILVASGVTIYFVYYTPKNNNNETRVLSLQALAVDSSTANISANLNIARNSSNLIRIGMYVNGTYLGSYNFTGSSACCLTMMKEWNNGTLSYYFSVTPYYMPMMNHYSMGMGGGYWKSDRNCMITIMATFANGERYNATALVPLNQYGMGSMMGSMMR